MVDSKRLNKQLVELGLASSRRAADELIRSGQVTRNGEVISQLATQVSSTDIIKVSGQAGQKRNDIYLLFNKPAGYVCSHSAQDNSPTIFSLLPKTFSNLKIAGRLDRDSHGLLLLSSDGDFVHHVTHPSFVKNKFYQVKLDRPLAVTDQRKLLAGVRLSDGVSKFDELKMITLTRLRLSIHTGKNRQIRRSFEALGYTVGDLRRYQIGESLTLTGVEPGKYRFLTAREVGSLCRH